MIRRLRPWLIAAACLSTLPAAAQTGDFMAMGMQIHNNAGREPMGDPRRAHDMAVCYAERDGTAGTLAQMPHTRPESSVVMHEFIYGSARCHPDDRRFLIAGRFLRGGAAEYLMKRQGGPGDVAVFPMPSAEALQALDQNIRAPIIFIVIGECAARANPDGVRALLATEVGTPQERAAFGPVVPSLAGCVPSGVTFNLPPLLIRGYLAEGALRNAVAARAETH